MVPKTQLQTFPTTTAVVKQIPRHIGTAQLAWSNGSNSAAMYQLVRRAGDVASSADAGFIPTAIHWSRRSIAWPNAAATRRRQSSPGNRLALTSFPISRPALRQRLFGAVVAMSGSTWEQNGSYPPLAESEKTGLKIQQTLKLNSLDEMRQAPAHRILGLRKGVPGWRTRRCNPRRQRQSGRGAGSRANAPRRPVMCRAREPSDNRVPAASSRLHL
jgi:hypothetical protein